MVLSNAERQKRYGERHPDRLKTSKQKYRQTEKGKQTEKKYQESYKEKRIEITKRYQQKHPEKKREWARTSYHRNKHKHIEKCRQRNRMNNKHLKEQCMNHYCNGNIQCQLCGITDIDVLTIDHIYGGGNRLRKEFGERLGQGLYRDLIKNNFPDGYRVLCFNCNHKESLRLKLRGKKASDEQIKKYKKKREG